MPYEHLSAVFASFIPLIPLLLRRGAQDVDWINIITDTRPFAPQYYIPPDPPKDQALVKLYSPGHGLDLSLGSRWLWDAIWQPLDTSLPVFEALGAIRVHFHANVATFSLLLWVGGLLFLFLVLLGDLPGVPESCAGDTIDAAEREVDLSSTVILTSAPAPDERIERDTPLNALEESNETSPLPSFGYPLSTSPLTPVEEESDVASTPLSDVAETSSGLGSVFPPPFPSTLGMSSLSSCSSETGMPNLLSPAASLPWTPSHHFQSTPFLSVHPSQALEASVSVQSFSPSLDNADTLSTSESLFAVVPPNTCDLNSVADLGFPTSSHNQATETLTSPAFADVPSTAGCTRLSPFSPVPESPVSLEKIQQAEEQVHHEEGRDSDESLDVPDAADLSNASGSPAAADLEEGCQPVLSESEVDLSSSPPHHARALSNITEVTEPSESDHSTAGTPRVGWFSSIHGRFTSFGDDGLMLHSVQEDADIATAASTPEVQVGFDWSLVDVPSGMEEFLPLSTSTPNIHSLTQWGPTDDSVLAQSENMEALGDQSVGSIGDLGWRSDVATDVGTPELPRAHSAATMPPDSDSEASSVDADIEDEDGGEGCSGDATVLPSTMSLPDVNSAVRSDSDPEERSPSLSSDADEVTAATSASVSPVNASPVVSSPVHPASASTSAGYVATVALPPSDRVVTPTAMPPSSVVVVESRATIPEAPAAPMSTHARRASKVLVARMGIAGQQVTLTDAGLAQLVARLDKPLPPDEDVRGERRRMERVTNATMATHSADRGEPRDMFQVIHERRYSNEPIAAWVERDIVNAAYHPPLRNDPHIRIPVCEVGRSRSSERPRSTTHVALVRRPSVSTFSSQDVSAVTASPLVLPRSGGRRRSQSEAPTPSASTTAITEEQGSRLSYAAIAARGVPVRPPQQTSVAHDADSKDKVKTVPIASASSSSLAKSRTVSAPAWYPFPSHSRSFTALPPRLEPQASWRNGNRWSALALDPSPSSPPEDFKSFDSDQGEARGQEFPAPTAAKCSPVPNDGHGSPDAEQRWPQSRLMKFSTQASSTVKGKSPEAMSSDRENVPVSSGVGVMRGSLLSATSRVRLRDLALSAQKAGCTPDSSMAAASCHAAGSGSGSGSGSASTASGSGSGATSGISDSDSGSSSADSVLIVCSGATCVPISYAQFGFAVTDKAAFTKQTAPHLPLPGPSIDLSANQEPACVPGISLEASKLESALLLPTCSALDVQCSTLDESADLVVASQEYRPPSPTGEREVVVKLKASSSSAPASFGSRLSTIPPTLSPSPMSLSADASILLASAPVPTLQEGIPSRDTFTFRAVAVGLDQRLGVDLKTPLDGHEYLCDAPGAAADHQRAMTDTLLGWEQEGVRIPGFTWRRREQS